MDALGTTPDEVADALCVRGITGVRNAARFLSPVVRYVRTISAEVYGIDLINPETLRIVFADREVTEVSVPGLLDLFHRGAYPDLEMPIGPGS